MPDDSLAPAVELAKKGSKPFPNESDSYRKARTKLLAEEIELRRHIQRVAAMRRVLPEYRNFKRPFSLTRKVPGLVSLSTTRVFGLEPGTFRAIHRPEAPSFWAFWSS